MYTWLLTSNPHTSGCVHKSKYFWIFPSYLFEPFDSLTSIFLEIAHIWPLITPLEWYIRNPLDTLKEEELKRNKTIVHCCHSLHILEFASLCTFGALCVLPKLVFACELSIERWRIEVVEDSVSLVCRRANKGCHLCNL